MLDSELVRGRDGAVAEMTILGCARRLHGRLLLYFNVPGSITELF
jgi:hypothetical protein